MALVFLSSCRDNLHEATWDSVPARPSFDLPLIQHNGHLGTLPTDLVSCKESLVSQTDQPRMRETEGEIIIQWEAVVTAWAQIVLLQYQIQQY